MIFSGTTALYVGNSSYSKAYVGSTLVWPLNIDYKTMYLTMKFLEPGYICFKKGDSSAMSLTVYYSKNGGEWTSVSSANAEQIQVDNGDEIRWKGNNSAYTTTTDHPCQFSGSSTFNLYGNINSLLSGDTFTETGDLAQYAFRKFFSGSRVVDASNLYLNFNTVNIRSLSQLMSYCNDLIASPSSISAQTVNEYGIGAVCYMCKNLISGTSLYAGTTSGRSNYAQFYEGDTALTYVKEIVTNEATNNCFDQAFYGCTSLKRAPDLLINTLKTSSFNKMFYNCSNLEYIKCLATNPSAAFSGNWVYGVKETGTFVKLSGVTWTIGVNGIPTGWVVQEEPGPIQPTGYTLQRITSFSQLSSGDTYVFIDPTNKYIVGMGSTWSNVYFEDFTTSGIINNMPSGYKEFVFKGTTTASGDTVANIFIKSSNEMLYVTDPRNNMLYFTTANFGLEKNNIRLIEHQSGYVIPWNSFWAKGVSCKRSGTVSAKPFIYIGGVEDNRYYTYKLTITQ